MNNKKVVFKVHSIRQYAATAEEFKSGDHNIHVRVDQYLYEGNAFAEMDSTVYDFDDFKDIHEIYIDTMHASQLAYGSAKPTFEYEYFEYTRYIERLKKELQALQNG